MASTDYVTEKQNSGTFQGRPETREGDLTKATGASASREASVAVDAGSGLPSRRLEHALFEEAESQTLKDRWARVQGSFVDEPRRAVKEADALVADVMKRLADGFTKERSGLEQQWDRGAEVTTEDLRVALVRYHEFFDRLLSI